MTDGFEGDDCLDDGIIRDKNGNFWILTSDKVVKFEPSRLRVNKTPPVLHYTGFYFKNDSLQWKSVVSQGFYYGLPAQINLNYRQKSIKITFAGISMTNPEKVTYRYRLSGFSKEWSQPGKERSVAFENLPRGKYTFELTAANADGVYSPQPLRLDFKIVPAFWQTTIFLVLVIILFIGINALTTWFWFKRRQLRIAKDQKLKSELSRLQMSSVLNQFDKHFTFNVISSIGSLIMKENREAAYEYITKFSMMLRSVLSDGSLIIIPLSDEIDFVEHYCELQKLRFKERFSYSVNISGNVDRSRKIPKMTIQTFVENSVKHGIEHKPEGGNVDVEVSKEDSVLQIIVRAAALELETAGTGKGLKIINEIFDMMNKTNRSRSMIELTDLGNDGVPLGTEVRITIPDDFSYDSF
jgi:hypothetical protein